MTKDVTTDGPEETKRVVKPIPVANITVQSDGQAFKHLFVRLPQDYTMGDLTNAGIWRNAQGYPDKSLRKFDRVTIVSYAEDWMAEAVVTSANAISATISKPTRIDLASRAFETYSDGKYKIDWAGSGFTIFRITDGQAMCGAIATMAGAQRELDRLYAGRAH